VFDALAKVKDAETLIVTRSVTMGDSLKKLCTTVHGRAVRLKKGPTIVPPTAMLPAPHAGSTPAPAAPPPIGGE
jgi:hypothetical protein